MILSVITVLVLSLNSAFDHGSGDAGHLFPYALAVQDTTSPATVINPALLPCCRGLVLSASAGRPFYGFDLDSSAASVQYSGKSYGISGRWNSFGYDEYRENSFSAGLGYAFLSCLAAGVTADAYRLSIDTDESKFSGTAYDSGAGILFMPADWIQAGALYRNISSLVRMPQFLYDEWSCGLLLKPCTGLTLSWNVTDTPAGRLNSYSLTVNPLRNLSSGFGYSAESSSFTAGFGVHFSGFKVCYGIRYHPYLGYSHSVSITYAANWDVETLEYGAAPIRQTKRININTASYDELMSLGILSERSARRIILYREQIGPVSKEALIRAGLLPEEIKSIAAAGYGFEKDKDGTNEKRKKSKKKNEGKYLARKEKVKLRFRKMLDSGIPAYHSALYSDLSLSDNEAFSEKLADDRSLSESQKKTIREICTE